jgi:hypothetical protein
VIQHLIGAFISGLVRLRMKNTLRDFSAIFGGLGVILISSHLPAVLHLIVLIPGWGLFAAGIVSCVWRLWRSRKQMD